MLDFKQIQKEYSFLNDEIFLDVSRVVMPPLCVQNVYSSFMKEYICDFNSDVVSRLWDMVEYTRKKVAQLIHCESDEIGFVKNTCEGISILANGFPFEKGDNVVLVDQEHSANLFPWIRLHEYKGVDLHIVKSINGSIQIEDIANQIDEHTKLLIISSIQFSTGYYADLETLGKICEEKGILFCVDGIQALGRMHIDVKKMRIGWMASGTNKGLLSTLGAGFVYCDKKYTERIIPSYASYQSVENHVSPPSITTNFEYLEWHKDARRFESGNLSCNCILALNKGVEWILELGMEDIEKYILSLEDYLRNKIKDIHLPVVQLDKKNQGGIICIYYPENKEDKVDEICKKYKIHCTRRGGYIRLGLDFYNTFEQMDIVSEAINKIDLL